MSNYDEYISKRRASLIFAKHIEMDILNTIYQFYDLKERMYNREVKKMMEYVSNMLISTHKYMQNLSVAIRDDMENAKHKHNKRREKHEI